MIKKTIEINYEEGEGIDKEEFKGTVTLRRLNFTEKNNLENDITETKVMGRTPTININQSRMKELAIFKSKFESNLYKTTYSLNPVTKELVAETKVYELDMPGIQNLPDEVGNLLFIEFSELQNVSQKKN